MKNYGVQNPTKGYFKMVVIAATKTQVVTEFHFKAKQLEKWN